jgi:hypothetical protein
MNRVCKLSLVLALLSGLFVGCGNSADKDKNRGQDIPVPPAEKGA